MAASAPQEADSIRDRTSETPAWVAIQKKTFTRWANTFLKERILKVDDLETDLKDGTLLIALLEVISSKSVGNYTKKPKLRQHSLENNMIALKFLQTEGIKLVNIGNEDIVDGKLKLILGLIWTIILRYQINLENAKSARNDLLQWVRGQIPEYNINNFHRDWNDGRALCGLVHSLKPELLANHRELDPSNALDNATLGAETAERDMSIPKVLEPQDMVSNQEDELAVMTYISFFRDWMGLEERRRKAAEIERTPVAEKCKAYGPGYEKAETGVPTEFTIEAINAHGRRLAAGGTPFRVTMEGPNGPVGVTVNDNADGTYTAKYQAADAGKHTIEVTLFEKQISNSPKTINATRSGPELGQVKAYGPGLEGGVVGEPATFTIEAFNKAGNRVTDGGDPFKVTVQGPHNAEVKVELVDNRDGTYSAAYHPVLHGAHTVNVTLNNQHIPKSPFNVGVEKNPNEPDATYSIAHGEGLKTGSTSEKSSFTVEVFNAKGERYTQGGALIDINIEDPQGKEVEPNKVDNNDGSFSVSFEPKVDGKYTVEVVLRNKHQPLFSEQIKDSPFHPQVEPGTDASKTIAFGPGLEDKVYDTLPTYFTIQSKDRYGNNITTGGDPFTVQIEGPKGDVPAKLKDNGDGTYRVDYSPEDAGRHKIKVEVKDKPIQGSAFTVDVNEGADENHSGIEQFTFTIRARTKNGGDKKVGGDAFSVAVHSQAGEEVPDVKLKDLGDGSYHVAYKLPGPGDYAIDVMVNGKHIKGSPWKQNV